MEGFELNQSVQDGLGNEDRSTGVASTRARLTGPAAPRALRPEIRTRKERKKMRIAIIGSGVSGLVCAHLLHGRHDVVLYETDERAGGHSHTHRVELPDTTVEVDTGFLVYNERTYPLFCRLIDRLGVATQPSDMSFGVADRRTGLEWRATSLSTVFAQRRNIARSVVPADAR